MANITVSLWSDHSQYFVEFSSLGTCLSVFTWHLNESLLSNQKLSRLYKSTIKSINQNKPFPLLSPGSTKRWLEEAHTNSYQFKITNRSFCFTGSSVRYCWLLQKIQEGQNVWYFYYKFPNTLMSLWTNHTCHKCPIHSHVLYSLCDVTAIRICVFTINTIIEYCGLLWRLSMTIHVFHWHLISWLYAKRTLLDQIKISL